MRETGDMAAFAQVSLAEKKGTKETKRKGHGNSSGVRKIRSFWKEAWEPPLDARAWWEANNNLEVWGYCIARLSPGLWRKNTAPTTALLTLFIFLAMKPAKWSGSEQISEGIS